MRARASRQRTCRMFLSGITNPLIQAGWVLGWQSPGTWLMRTAEASRRKMRPAGEQTCVFCCQGNKEDVQARCGNKKKRLTRILMGRTWKEKAEITAKITNE